MKMFPKVGGRCAQVHVERPELAIARTDFVEAHLVNDLLERIGLMRHERDAPLPVIDPGRPSNELRDSARELASNPGVAGHQFLASGEIKSIPVIRAAATFAHWIKAHDFP